MNDDRAALERFNGRVRLFPLPNLVFFPQVIQALNVFEIRYRQMMADAVAGDMTLAIVLLKPGWEPAYEGRPAVHRVACLGRITQYELLPDGQYTLLLKGLSRVRIVSEFRTDAPFRTAAADLVPDSTGPDLHKLVMLRQELSDAVLPRFPAGGAARRHIAELFAGDTPLGPLTDMLAYALPMPREFRQQLLEEPRVEVRADVLASHLRRPAVGSDRPFPPAFSAN